MTGKLYYETVTPLLRSVLKWTMRQPVFNPFRLVGGTALSLQLGHRKSVDVDMFTDAEYGSIDFPNIDKFLKINFNYVDSLDLKVALGKSYFLGKSEKQSIKFDLFYNEPFIRPEMKIDGIRFASPDDLVAMKIDVIGRGGRKKDFWDIHELLEIYSLNEMIDLHKERYPYAHNEDEIFSGLRNFLSADDDFDPVCLKGKYWELIKLDIVEALEQIN